MTDPRIDDAVAHAISNITDMVSRWRVDKPLGNRQFYILTDVTETLYVRVGWRYLEGIRRAAIDIASVSVRPEFEGKGFFTTFLDCLEPLAQGWGMSIYVESVLAPRFARYFARRDGYELHDFGNIGPPCFYRLPPSDVHPKTGRPSLDWRNL